MTKAKAWREEVVIPTYEVGQPEKNPIFLEKRVYQGSSGVVYPYPVIESISDVKTDKTYHAVFIENEYIKVMVLPELGGRIQMAYDKVKERHFIYYNHVIKPALVGLAGPWISGGVEFNWPQHHRPSTYMPVDCTIEEHDDGSVSVWVNERERMFHQQGQAGFTLRPGCAYLEIHGRLYNPTELPQTFLWWANPAVEVNAHYQSVFPPDVNAVFDHGKRAVSSFPIATGTYYKMDYSAGVDISNYKNIYVPTSYMVAKSRYNFEGGYENDSHGGMLHVADHHVSPGKKQWTWGNGDFGRAWDRNLTDNDYGDGTFRPYIELMAGVYTENQPDFSWLMPYEEKRFVQYFMPYRELGMVKNASKDLMLNVEEILSTSQCNETFNEQTGHSKHDNEKHLSTQKDARSRKVRVMVFGTSNQTVEVVLKSKRGEIYYDQTIMVSPEKLLDEVVNVKDESIHNLRLELLKSGRIVLDWEAEPDVITPIPDAAEAALLPSEIKTTEQLFLTGLHLEQYRHATWCALDYYEEALRRDPDDVRCNNQTGLWYLRRGRFAKAEPYFRKAVRVLQKRNPNPYDGEPLYNLGLCLKYQGQLQEAYDWFYKSTWNRGWQDAGYLSCAQISCALGHYEDALYEVEQSLVNGWHNHKARALKLWLLKQTGANESAISHFASESLSINPFNYAILYECGDIEKMKILMRGDANNYDELALDFVAAGLYTDALSIWEIAIEENATTAMTYYYIAWLTGKDKDHEAAMRQSIDYCFPNRLEAVLALQSFTDDIHALYLLGCLYYDKRQYDAVATCWENKAFEGRENEIAGYLRGMALLTYNHRRDETDFATKALDYMERAFAADESDSRIFMELDQLYKKLQKPHQFRLAKLQSHPELTSKRDDLVLEEITLLNQLGRYAEAKSKLDSHIFHPWEGGEGKVSGQYQLSRRELAKELIKSGKDYQQAIALLNECLKFPPNLGEGKLYGAQDNDFYFYLGIAFDRLGEHEKAMEMWRKGTVGPTEPAAAMYYNDAKPDKIYFAGLCFHALGENDKARSLFHKLISYGEQHYYDHVTMDYFAVSLPDLLVWDGDLDLQNRIHCNYMLALGYAGLGEKAQFKRYIDAAVSLDINHQGIMALKRDFSSEK
jgi:tetratricopeptide (TPR) repeat protein